MRRLHVSDDLSLPATAVTDTFAILAIRGAGKTNTGRVIAEEMFAAKAPFVAVDPVGVWWGLRAGREGKPGLPIVVFGGRHGDVPLERGGGNLVADLVVDQRLSCVLDLSTFESEAAKKQFLLDFFQRLYQRNTEPLHLFLEEADDYLPQSPLGDEKKLLRAAENIVRRGRSKGIGMTMITQRSAVLNKNVLTQASTLIAMRVVSPQDRDAIAAWVKHNSANAEILASLADLKDGEAWVLSPQLLQKTVRTRFRLSTTFDSGATPKLGQGREAATLADVDLGTLQQRMADTIERQKQEDPKALRLEIARLKKDLETARKQQAPAPKPDLSPMVRSHLKALQTNLGDSLSVANHLEAAMLSGTVFVVAPGAMVEGRDGKVRVHPQKVVRVVNVAAAPPSEEIANLGRCERTILAVLRQSGESDIGRITLLGGYRVTGGFKNALGRLREAGLIEGGNTETMRLTPAGEGAAAAIPALPSGRALVDYWRTHASFGTCEKAILEVLIREAPERVCMTDLAAWCEPKYRITGGFKNALGRLRTAGVLSGKNTESMRLSDELIEALR